VTSDGGIRAYAQKADDADLSRAGKLLGKGYLAFTVSEQSKDVRYQGIVELEGQTLAEGVQHYFRQSEQIPTGIIAAVHRDGKDRWHGGCLMLQRLPREGGIWTERDTVYSTAQEDDWHRAMLLMGSCTPAEITDRALPPNDLLYRLFNEDGVRVYEPHPFRHQCRCSEQRVTAMLRALPPAEVEDLAVDGIVTVTCEFCNKSYRFDEKQRQQLFERRKT